MGCRAYPPQSHHPNKEWSWNSPVLHPYTPNDVLQWTVTWANVCWHHQHSVCCTCITRHQHAENKCAENKCALQTSQEQLLPRSVREEVREHGHQEVTVASYLTLHFIESLYVNFHQGPPFVNQCHSFAVCSTHSFPIPSLPLSPPTHTNIIL